MKCACGYDEYEYDLSGEITNKKESFIYSDVKIIFESDGNCYSQTKSETIYICPKCGTLKINII